MELILFSGYHRTAFQNINGCTGAGNTITGHKTEMAQNRIRAGGQQAQKSGYYQTYCQSFSSFFILR